VKEGKLAAAAADQRTSTQRLSLLKLRFTGKKVRKLTQAHHVSEKMIFNQSSHGSETLKEVSEKAQGHWAMIAATSWPS
jgi:hypothetical protein